MDSNEPQAAAYHGLLDNARAMLIAAQDERWDDFAAFDGQRRACLTQVQKADLQADRTQELEFRLELIRAILECDAQTISLAAARRDELAAALGSLGNERKLADAYPGA